MFVRTERLFLRPAWPEDFDDVAEAMIDGDPVPTCGLSSAVGGADDLRARLQAAPDPRLPQFFMYLRAPGGPKLVGGIGLGRSGSDVEVGYWIAARHRGRGFAGEALRAVLNQARSLGYRQILANDFHEQPGAYAALESAGFRDTGRERSIYDPARAMEYAARVYVAELEAGAGFPRDALP